MLIILHETSMTDSKTYKDRITNNSLKELTTKSSKYFTKNAKFFLADLSDNSKN